MNKSGRINQELVFVNVHRAFHLNDLMNQFGISRSTALRDLDELRELGLGIVACRGRYGGYLVEAAVPLPPIVFSEGEDLTLFFALQLLRPLTATPFGYSYQHIKDKLIQGLPDDRRKAVRAAMGAIRYQGAYRHADGSNLAELFTSIMERRTVTFTYGSGQTRLLNPVRLTLDGGFWYCVGSDPVSREWRTFRCDRMEIADTRPRTGVLPDLKDEQRACDLDAAAQRTIRFRVLLTKKGEDYFIRNSYPNMYLSHESCRTFLTGTIKPDEYGFLVTYLLGFGDQATIVGPRVLQERYRGMLLHLLNR